MKRAKKPETVLQEAIIAALAFEPDVAIWRIAMDPGAQWVLPAATGADTLRVLYVFEADGLTVAGTHLADHTGVLLRGPADVALEAGSGGVEMLLLQGRPIGEPVVQYGPFVMNDRAGIEAAFRDYQRDGFGGWPWPSDGPVHDAEPGRFARHADGRVERRDDWSGAVPGPR